MPATKKEFLDSLLREFGKTGGVDASAVVSREGFLVSSSLPAGMDAETLAAMSAIMFGAAETAVRGLKKGDIERVIVETGEVKLVAVGAGPSFVLVALAGPKANLGLVLVEIRKVAVCIEESFN